LRIIAVSTSRSRGRASAAGAPTALLPPPPWCGTHLHPQARPERHLERGIAAPGGIEHHVQRQREQVVEMQGVLVARQRLVQHLPGRRVGARDMALRIDAQQPLGGLAARAAGPGQVQQQLAGLAHHQRVLDAARGQRGQVAQFGSLDHLHAGQVEHAGAFALRIEEWRARAAVDAGVVEEVFAAVQPYRLQLGQGGADGGGADGCALTGQPPRGRRRVRAARRGVAQVGQRSEVHDDAAGVGQHGEVTRIGDACAPGARAPAARRSSWRLRSADFERLFP
jgi:hypothetical protein